jgi:predicted amino acid-binding ACT domain protein
MKGTVKLRRPPERSKRLGRQRSSLGGIATTTEVRTLLETTSLPTGLVEDLLVGASPIWLMSDPADVIAGDLALCYPALGPDEVRASIQPTSDRDVWRATVVARDRNGLLARIAGAFAIHGMSIVRVSANAWPNHGMALLRVFATGPADEESWQAIGAELRDAIASDELPTPAWIPLPPVKVVASPQDGRTLVRLTAPDRIGLVWAVSAWLAQHGCNIEVARVDGDGTTADDTFVVDGQVDIAALTTHLSGQEAVADVSWWTHVLRRVRGLFSG